MNHYLTLSALALGMACLNPLQAALVEIDNFDTVTTGSLLSSVEGWSLLSGTDDATVTNTGSDAYATQASQAVYRRTLGSGEAVTFADGLCAFSMSVTLSGPTDQWKYFTLQLVDTVGGVNSLALQFQSGGTVGPSDNYVRISNGGNGWSAVNWTNYTEAQWELGHNYNIYIEFTLLESGKGEDVTGTVSIYDETASTYLLQDVAIGATGAYASQPFEQVDAVNLGGAGSWESRDYRLGAIPEPSTMSMLLGALCLLTFVRCRRMRRV